MEEKKLYPTRFCTLQDDYNWGSEEFRLADLGYRDSLVRDGWLAGNAISEVMDMYMDRIVGENVFEFWGRQFPVQVKTINVSGKMPLRVHPDDETAAQRYDFLGKEKLWYIVSAASDAHLMIGFSKDTDATAVYEKCLDNTVGDILNAITPHAGEYYHIPPGTPHAASGSLKIIEISESSPLDFCMCSWGEEVSTEEFDPSLSLIDALDFIGYKTFRRDAAAKDGLLADLTQFQVSRMELSAPLRSKSGEYDSFIIYTCVKGSASVQLEILGQTASFPFSEGETLLVPAECPDFVLAPAATDTVILETTIPFASPADPYINPSAEATLPGEEN